MGVVTVGYPCTVVVSENVTVLFSTSGTCSLTLTSSGTTSAVFGYGRCLATFVGTSLCMSVVTVRKPICIIVACCGVLINIIIVISAITLITVVSIVLAGCRILCFGVNVSMNSNIAIFIDRRISLNRQMLISIVGYCATYCYIAGTIGIAYHTANAIRFDLERSFGVDGFFSLKSIGNDSAIFNIRVSSHVHANKLAITSLLHYNFFKHVTVCE